MSTLDQSYVSELDAVDNIHVLVPVHEVPTEELVLRPARTIEKNLGGTFKR